jgi:hypothetical protein
MTIRIATDTRITFGRGDSLRLDQSPPSRVVRFWAEISFKEMIRIPMQSQAVPLVTLPGPLLRKRAEPLGAGLQT